MVGEQIALWLGIVSVSIAVFAAVLRGMLAVYRFIRGRIVRHRNRVVQAAVKPLFDERAEHVDAELSAIRHSQEELSAAIGTTTRRVADLEATIDGLPDDIADMKKEQTRAGKRIDSIHDHLID